MIAKPVKTFELYYPMIQLLVIALDNAIQEFSLA